MPDYKTLIEEKLREQASLDARMQVDADLARHKAYVMTDLDKETLPNVINVTMNRPGVFAANVLSALGGASQQAVVESENRGVDTKKIEAFQTAAFAAANAMLRKQPGRDSLNVAADSHLCLRGRAARRVLFREEDGILIPEITPWDGRYVLYDTDGNGLAWAAYQNTRSKRQIETRYHVTIAGETGKVWDVWDREHNEVFVDAVRAFEEPHDYGEVPVVIQIVSLGYGSSMEDEGRIEHEGESIFFLIRRLIPEYNRLASILQTLNQKAAMPPIKETRLDGGDPTPYGEAMALMANTPLRPGEDIGPIDYGDAKRSAELLLNKLEQALQIGSVSDIDLGNPPFALSAVALVALGEGKDQVFLPRLDAKAWLNQATAEMFTRQVIKIGGTVELGIPGHKTKFNTHDLEGEYTTTYKYFTKSPTTDIARMSVAQTAKEFFSKEDVLKEILHVEDWKGVLRRKYSDMSEVVFPIVLQSRIIMSTYELAKQGDEDAEREVKLMTGSMRMTLAQIQAGQLPAPPEAPKGTEPALSLLGKDGQVGGIPSSAQKANALMLRAPEEEA